MRRRQMMENLREWLVEFESQNVDVGAHSDDEVDPADVTQEFFGFVEDRLADLDDIPYPPVDEVT